MKAHKYYPLEVKPGNHRLALLELSHWELEGLKQVVDDAVISNVHKDIVILNFEEDNSASNPVITAIYYTEKRPQHIIDGVDKT